ncbi:chemotaxis protein CheB [Runella sp. MFBS21]|uniref:chemotaxis protein CheB n=1 Tax=Runella sp. MFBS21 TaxID=3034018 RepID=UPI0023F9B016|nr:chemotaxis protein CheB [Runella sp. MFBS21]MDF7820051.1 chemotaxis protein CheB [Runella sp. MFBS21]
MAENRLIKDCKVVVIGGSSGSLEVLLELLPDLPSPMPFVLIVVVHRKNSNDSSLADLFSYKTSLPIQEVEDKDVIEKGHIYLAPADYHLLLEKNGFFSLDDSEKVNYSRPALDVTFESVADVCGRSSVAILLSGANADGTQGLKAIQKAGGVTVVQKPDTAKVPFMPQQAINQGVADWILDIPQITALIQSL